MAVYEDLLDAIARVRAGTGDADAWMRGLSGDDLAVEVPPGCGRHMGEDRHYPVPSTRFQTKIGEIRHDRVDRDPALLGKPTGLLQSNRGHVDSCDGESALGEKDRIATLPFSQT
mgnify:CR=1 FL=1